MRSSRLSLCLVAALAVACGCASNEIAVSTNYDPLVRFPTTATYSWDVGANSLPDNPALDRASLDALFRSVIDEGFAAHGYRMVDAGTAANYTLSYHYTVHTYLGPDVSRALGSFSLLLTDRATGQRVWVGFGRAEVHADLAPEERRARLARALERMLENFPPS